MSKHDRYPQIEWTPGGTLAAAWSAIRYARLRVKMRQEYSELILAAAAKARKDRLRPRRKRAGQTVSHPAGIELRLAA